MFRGLRDLCSCHKSREKDADDDDLPYSPKKSTVFFGSKKNAVTDKTLTSTPNQLINVRKLNENDLIDNMDVRNNNKYSASTNDASLMSSDLNNLPNSPIEKDSTTCINLDSNDDLNRLSMDEHNFGDHSNDQRTPSFRNANGRPPDDQRNAINDLTGQFSSSPWFKSNDEQRCANDSNENQPISQLPKNSSTNNLLSSNQPTADRPFVRNRSETNLSSLESANGDKLVKPNGRNSHIDSTDNMAPISSSTNHLDKFSQLPPSKGHLTDVEMHNLLNRFASNLNDSNKNAMNKQPIRRGEHASKFSSLRNQTNEPSAVHQPDRRTHKDDLNDLNAITSLINLPTNSDSLKRVSSDDKISLDNSSIESVVIDRFSNEIVRKGTHSNESADQQHSNAIKHPNSIIIQECLTLTLKRDKSEKKSLNEFSMENLPRHMFENNSSLMKEYFYDEPIIKTTSRFFEEDLATYRMQSDPRGYCLIINNATTKLDCLRLKNGFVKETNYFKDLFTKLGFIVEVHSNVNAKDILKLMKKASKLNFVSHDAFVCIFLGHGNQNYVIGEDHFKLNLELMIGCMNNYHCPQLIKKPKIFIVHTCNSSCQQFFEPIPPSNIPRAVQGLKKISNFRVIPTWTDTVIIYSPHLNTNLYYSSFVKEFGLMLCSNACENSLHDILLQVGFVFENEFQTQNAN